MNPTIPLSEAASRTNPPVITSLMQVALADPTLISLAAGFVDQRSLPAEATRAAVDAILTEPVEGRRALQYGTTIGDVGFRAELLRLLERGEGVVTGTFDPILPRVVVTQGSQQLLYLIAEALLDPGDIVLVESPTYFVFLGVLETRGARAIGIPVDEGGLRLDALEETLEALDLAGELGRVKLIYTISEHSNPTGLSLAVDRRGPLVAMARRWSKERPILILEDAAYRGLSHTDRPEPGSVWGHDPAGETVILARTFSKTYSPGVKTGWGVIPESLIRPVLALKSNHDFGSSNFQQMLLARLLADGSYDRHVAGLRAMYAHKRDVFLAAMHEHFDGLDGLVSWTEPAGGLFVWLTAPEGLDLGPTGPVWPRAREEGVIYVPGQYAFAHEPGPAPTNHARLCFGVPSDADLSEGVRRLSIALAGCLDPVA